MIVRTIVSVAAVAAAAAGTYKAATAYSKWACRRRVKKAMSRVEALRYDNTASPAEVENAVLDLETAIVVMIREYGFDTKDEALRALAAIAAAAAA